MLIMTFLSKYHVMIQQMNDLRRRKKIMKKKFFFVTHRYEFVYESWDSRNVQTLFHKLEMDMGKASRLYAHEYDSPTYI